MRACIGAQWECFKEGRKKLCLMEVIFCSISSLLLDILSVSLMLRIFIASIFHACIWIGSKQILPVGDEKDWKKNLEFTEEMLERIWVIV